MGHHNYCASGAGLRQGEWLHEVLARVRNPEREKEPSFNGLQAALRPYQLVGAKWLALLTSLGLGACLADDMGLGKTIQVLALLLHLQAEQTAEPASPVGSRRRSDPSVEPR